MDSCYNCTKENHYLELFDACFPFLKEHIKNNSSNLTVQPLKRKEEIVLPITLILTGFLIFFILFTNILLIIGIVKTNKNLTLVNKLYIFWSILDFLGGLGPMSHLLYVLIAIRNLVPIKICENFLYYTTLFSLFGGMNMGTFILISVLRHLSIRKPFMKVKPRYVLAALVIIFVVYVIPNITLTFAAYSPKHNSYQTFFVRWVFVAVILYLAVALLLFFNTYSHIILSRKARSMSRSTQEVRNCFQQRAVKTLIMISCVYVICYIITATYYIFIITTKLISMKENLSAFIRTRRSFDFLSIPMILCSGLNGVVYIATNGKIKKYYRNLLKKNRVGHINSY